MPYRFQIGSIYNIIGKVKDKYMQTCMQVGKS